MILGSFLFEKFGTTKFTPLEVNEIILDVIYSKKDDKLYIDSPLISNGVQEEARRKKEKMNFRIEKTIITTWGKSLEFCRACFICLIILTKFLF